MKLYVSVLLFVVGSSLLAINMYGLTQNIRPENITNNDLRFINDQPLPYDEVIAGLNKRIDESDSEFAYRATNLIAKGLAHIHWGKYSPEKFNQLVPIWENYFLYLMSKVTTIPEYNRYHFADYKRSLERGIGICGDASMILSQVLNKHNIANNIIVYPGHVVVEATFNNQQSVLLDADFGVSIPLDKESTKIHYQSVAKLYTEQGYTENDRLFFEKMYKADYSVWRNVQHFITKKYYFEKISYMLKWPVPILFLLLSFYLFRKRKQ